jgi:hypothetical protein
VPPGYNPALAGVAGAGAGAAAAGAYPQPGQQALPYAGQYQQPMYAQPYPQQYLAAPGQSGYPPPYDDYDSEGYDSDPPRRHPRKAKSDSGLGRRDRYRDDDEEETDDRDQGEGRADSEDGERKNKKGKHSEIAITLAGALAGGLLGYEVSSRRGKPESFPALAGAVAGAMAAREGNKFYEGHKDEVKARLKRDKDALEGKKRNKHSYDY